MRLLVWMLGLLIITLGIESSYAWRAPWVWWWWLNFAVWVLFGVVLCLVGLVRAVGKMPRRSGPGSNPPRVGPVPPANEV